MARSNYRVDAQLTYASALASDFNQALRQSLTKSLAKYYLPPEDTPPDLCELLARLDESKPD